MMNKPKSKAFAFVIAVLVLLPGWHSAPLLAADALPALTAQLPELLDVDMLVERLEQIAARYPAQDHEVEALAEQLGNDPVRAFEYVRDRIGFLPYAGMLRGARGTLAAREGNHLDRALLLRDLMRLQGLEARLAVGQLTPEAATRLARRVFETGSVMDDRPEAALTMLGLGENALARLRARSSRDEQQLMATLAQYMDQADAGARIEVDQQRHTWVQARVEGIWVDFDPSLPNAEPGQTLAESGTTRERPAALDLHTVSLELFAESLAADGTLQRESVLQETLVAAEAASAQVFLTFAPDTAAGAPAAGALMRVAGTPLRYRPVLMVDGELSNGSFLPPVRQERSEAQSFFFGASESGPVLVALQLEVTTNYPGGEQQRIRTLLDRVPAADRLAGDYAADRLLALQEIDTTPSFLASVHQIVISTGSADPRRLAKDIAFGFDYFGRELLDPEQFKDRSLHEMLWPLGARNLALALAAERLSVAALNDREDLRFLVASPRVYLMSIVPRTRADLPTRDVEIDLLLDHVDWISVDDQATRAVVERRVRYGALQQALETTLVELAAIPLGLDAAAVSSASMHMEAGLRIAAAGDLDAAQMAPAMREDIASERVVLVAPERHDTWWTFDPTDASLVARLAPDLGGGRLRHTLPRSSSAGGRVGDMVRQPQGAGDTYRRVGNRLIREGADSPSNNCSGGGTEYTIVMCNVSIKISMSTGTAYTIIVGEVVAAVVATLLQL